MKKDKASFNKFFEVQKNKRKNIVRQQLAVLRAACDNLDQDVTFGFSYIMVHLSKKDVSNIMDKNMLDRYPKKIILPEVRREVRKWGYKLKFEKNDNESGDIIFEMSIRFTPLRVLKLFLLSRGLL